VPYRKERPVWGGLRAQPGRPLPGSDARLRELPHCSLPCPAAALHTLDSVSSGTALIMLLWDLSPGLVSLTLVSLVLSWCFMLVLSLLHLSIFLPSFFFPCHSVSCCFPFGPFRACKSLSVGSPWSLQGAFRPLTLAAAPSCVSAAPGLLVGPRGPQWLFGAPENITVAHTWSTFTQRGSAQGFRRRGVPP